MVKHTIMIAATALGIMSLSAVAAAANPPTDFGPLNQIPFGGTLYRHGDKLLNKVASALFGSGGAVRSTNVFVYNHSPHTLYLLSSSFSSGGFSPGSHPSVIGGKTVHGYNVESHGVLTGVTNADLRFGTAPGASTHCLRIVTSNPYAGDNHASAEAFCGMRVDQPISTVGNNNEVYIDVW